MGRWLRERNALHATSSYDAPPSYTPAEHSEMRARSSAKPN